MYIWHDTVFCQGGLQNYTLKIIFSNKINKYDLSRTHQNVCCFGFPKEKIKEYIKLISHGYSPVVFKEIWSLTKYDTIVVSTIHFIPWIFSK